MGAWLGLCCAFSLALGQDSTHSKTSKGHTNKIQPILVPLWQGQSKQGTDEAPELLMKQIQKTLPSLKFAQPRTIPVEVSGEDLERVPLSEDNHFDQWRHVLRPSHQNLERDLEREKVREKVNTALQKLSDTAAELKLGKDRALFLGGDHSMSAGSIPGILRHRPSTHVLFVDAHADMTRAEESEYPYLHGMSLASAMGLDGSSDNPLHGPKLLEPSHLQFLGLRNLKCSAVGKFLCLGGDAHNDHDTADKTGGDPKCSGHDFSDNSCSLSTASPRCKKLTAQGKACKLVKEPSFHVTPPAEVNKDPEATAKAVLARWPEVEKKGECIHLSFDIDSLSLGKAAHDSRDASPENDLATGTPVANGIHPAAAKSVIRKLSPYICSMDVVEVNPRISPSGNNDLEAADRKHASFSSLHGASVDFEQLNVYGKETVNLAVSMVEAAFSKPCKNC